MRARAHRLTSPESPVLYLCDVTVPLSPANAPRLPSRPRPQISDYNQVPSTGILAERPRVCLQESDTVPADYTKLFDTHVFSINTRLVPQVRSSGRGEGQVIGSAGRRAGAVTVAGLL